MLFLCFSLLFISLVAYLFSLHGSLVLSSYSSLLIEVRFSHFPQIFSDSSASLACPSRSNKTLSLKIKSPNGFSPSKLPYSVWCYIEIILMLVKLLVFITLGCDLEPQFNEPYLATSLQDYWGRRWNLMIPAILRPAIYLPVRQLCRGRMSSDWARFLAVMVTFIVSGVGHEVFFFTITFLCHWSKNNETMTEITQLEIVLMLVKLLVFIIFGCDLEPQFNEPYLATSLQDFWGRRWNLMVTQLLKPAIYIPVRRLCNGRMSSDHARFLAVMATFIVSGVAHEVLFFTLTFEMPTGEVACFFVLHGVCTAAEIAAKRTEFVRRWRVSPTVSRLFTVGFVVMTSGWLLFPTAARSNMLERAADEALLSFDFFKRTFLYL
ncbi:unnamed protein product [Brassica oleracea]